MAAAAAAAAAVDKTVAVAYRRTVADPIPGAL